MRPVRHMPAHPQTLQLSHMRPVRHMPAHPHTLQLSHMRPVRHMPAPSHVAAVTHAPCQAHACAPSNVAAVTHAPCQAHACAPSHVAAVTRSHRQAFTSSLPPFCVQVISASLLNATMHWGGLPAQQLPSPWPAALILSVCTHLLTMVPCVACLRWLFLADPGWGPGPCTLALSWQRTSSSSSKQPCNQQRSSASMDSMGPKSGEGQRCHSSLGTRSASLHPWASTATFASTSPQCSDGSDGTPPFRPAGPQGSVAPKAPPPPHADAGGTQGSSAGRPCATDPAEGVHAASRNASLPHGAATPGADSAKVLPRPPATFRAARPAPPSISPPNLQLLDPAAALEAWAGDAHKGKLWPGFTDSPASTSPPQPASSVRCTSRRSATPHGLTPRSSGTPALPRHLGDASRDVQGEGGGSGSGGRKPMAGTTGGWLGLQEGSLPLQLHACQGVGAVVAMAGPSSTGSIPAVQVPAKQDGAAWEARVPSKEGASKRAAGAGERGRTSRGAVSGALQAMQADVHAYDTWLAKVRSLSPPTSQPMWLVGGGGRSRKQHYAPYFRPQSPLPPGQHRSWQQQQQQQQQQQGNQQQGQQMIADSTGENNYFAAMMAAKARGEVAWSVFDGSDGAATGCS